MGYQSTNATMKLTLLCLFAFVCASYAFPRPQQPRADPGYGKQPDGYFQYVNVPAHKEYEFGWNRGHPNHYISRYEQSKDHRFRTRVMVNTIGNTTTAPANTNQPRSIMLLSQPLTKMLKLSQLLKPMSTKTTRKFPFF